MKLIFRFTLTVFFVLLVTAFQSCKKDEVPVVKTTAISDIKGTTATSGGTIVSEGSGPVLSRGICWSTTNNPLISDSKTSDNTGPGSYSSNLTGLSGATKYYVRAYATNIIGVGYGSAISFTTIGQSPSAVLFAANSITINSVAVQGTVNPNLLPTLVTFELGTTTSYGISATANQSPVSGDADVNVWTTVSGLTPGATYHCRIKSVNSLGTAYSNDITFTTLGEIPVATTMAATTILYAGAQLNGSVNANYLTTDVTFEYGTTTSYGSIITASPGSATGNTVTNVIAGLTGLSGGTTYYYRIKAVNSLGTTYGNEFTFTTTSSGTVTDVEGNIYNTVSIGTQVWMKENLKTTKYQNGDLIGTTTPSSKDISAESTPKYQWAYDGDENNVAAYGRLYTWWAVTDSRNICPADWHVPTDSEWTLLTTFLGGLSVAGGKLKEAGTANWQSFNNSATNITGFTALPGGLRIYFGVYSDMFANGYWWTSTGGTQNAWHRWLSRNSGGVIRELMNNQYGNSVRCIKDN